MPLPPGASKAALPSISRGTDPKPPGVDGTGGQEPRGVPKLRVSAILG